MVMVLGVILMGLLYVYLFTFYSIFSHKEKEKKTGKADKEYRSPARELTHTSQMAAPKFVIHSRNVLNLPPVEVINHSGLMGWWFHYSVGNGLSPAFHSAPKPSQISVASASSSSITERVNQPQ